MKRFTALILAALMAFSFSGCGGSVNAEKYAQMAIDFILADVGVKINESTYYVKVDRSPKDYSYYSPVEEKDVVEYENIVARVYIKDDSIPYPLVIFISEDAVADYEANSGNWDNFDMFFYMTKAQTDNLVEINYSGDYPDAVKAQMWKNQDAQNKAYAPSQEELSDWIAVTF